MVKYITRKNKFAYFNLYLYFCLMIKGIKKLHKRRFDEAMLYGYVKALLLNLPTISINKAIYNFMEKYKITDDDINFNTLITTYHRIDKEFIEAQKTDINEVPGN